MSAVGVIVLQNSNLWRGRALVGSGGIGVALLPSVFSMPLPEAVGRSREALRGVSGSARLPSAALRP